MRQISIFEYFAFGYDYHLLRQGCASRPIHGEESVTWLITNFFNALEQLGLKVTENAANDLKVIRDELQEMAKDAAADTKFAKRITTAVNSLDITLDAELKLQSAYVITPKRFSIEHLRDEPYCLFGDGVFERMPEICRFDFSEACHCILFGKSTAAAFHVMRGVEECCGIFIAR